MKRRRIAQTWERRSKGVRLAQRESCYGDSGQTRSAIDIASAESFGMVHGEALAEAKKENTLDMERETAILNSVCFWARILGRDGQQKVLNFLQLVKSVERWVEPTKPYQVEEAMKKREDPEVLQRVVRTYMVQNSLKTLVGKVKFDRILHLANFYQHYQELLKDAREASGQMRPFFEERKLKRWYADSWVHLVNDYLVYYFGGHSAQSDHGFADYLLLRGEEHAEGLGSLEAINELSSSFYILKAKFGLGIFIFLLERPITM